VRLENSMIWDDRTTKDALLNTLGDELAAAWVRFYAIEVDSRPGELEYDRALAAAKKLEAALLRSSQQVENGLRAIGHFELSRTPAVSLLDYRRPPSVAVACNACDRGFVRTFKQSLGTNEISPVACTRRKWDRSSRSSLQ
jgi:hypothetical protein